MLLFAFSGTSGILAPAVKPDQLSNPNAGTTQLPGSWVADFRPTPAAELITAHSRYPS